MDIGKSLTDIGKSVTYIGKSFTDIRNSRDKCPFQRYAAENLVPDSKVHGANMGPTWVLSVPNGPHVGPMNLAFRVQKVMDISRHGDGYKVRCFS